MSYFICTICICWLRFCFVDFSVCNFFGLFNQPNILSCFFGRRSMMPSHVCLLYASLLFSSCSSVCISFITSSNANDLKSWTRRKPMYDCFCIYLCGSSGGTDYETLFFMMFMRHTAHLVMRLGFFCFIIIYIVLSCLGLV